MLPIHVIAALGALISFPAVSTAASTTASTKPATTIASTKTAPSIASSKTASTAASTKPASTAASIKTASTAASIKTASTAASIKTASTAASTKPASTSAPTAAIPAGIPADVPKPGDQVVLAHIAAQKKLIQSEQTHRDDWAFRQTLSAKAKLADAIVAKIRTTEIETIWTVAGTFANPEKESFPGQSFATARSKIASTDLFKVVKQMPKGAVLHAHLNAMLPYDIVFQTMMNTPGMVMSAKTNLATDENRNMTAIKFGHSNTTISAGPSIWTAQYVPGTLVNMTTAANSFPGGKAAFLAFLKSKVTLTAQDYHEAELGIDAIWRKFQGIFNTVRTTWAYEPLIRQFLQTLLKSLAADNIRWLEVRTGAAAGIVKNGDSSFTADTDAWYNLFIEELEKFKGTPAGKNFWGARIIWTVPRVFARDRILSDMQNALVHKTKYPNLISGYDLVGQEDTGRPLSDLAPELIWFRKQADAQNLTIPYFFHAGETLGDGTATDDNLFDAQMFNTRRVGHGFSLYKHPELMDSYRNNSIMVEVCLISNEALRLNGQVLQHPLPAMIAHGVPTALSNDDPAIMGQDDAGLSYDFYEAIQGFENLGLAGLGALAQNSVRYSNFEDQNDKVWLDQIKAGVSGGGIKATRMKQWNADWETFCQWVITEYGAKYNTTSI